MDASEVDAKYTVCMLLAGESGVGKTTMTRHLCGEDVHMVASPVTVGVDFFHPPVFELVLSDDAGVPRRIEIKPRLIDVPGTLTFANWLPSFYRGAHVMVLVYDVSRRQTFDALRTRWWPEVLKYTHNLVTTIVIGNKTDLPAGDHQVTPAEARAFAQAIGAQHMYQCSALVWSPTRLMTPVTAAAGQVALAMWRAAPHGRTGAFHVGSNRAAPRTGDSGCAC
jgi:GTPase SAR1 family protein